MSAGAESETPLRSAVPTTGPAPETTRADPGATHPPEHLLPEPREDRWAWRRKIRANPHRLRVYRVLVAVAGLLLVTLGVVSGPLPGPGGIPLVLLGLAVWASEFGWAHRLMLRFRHALHVFRTWSRPKQTLAWVIFFAGCGLLGYAYLLVLGLPAWMPHAVGTLLRRLPGV